MSKQYVYIIKDVSVTGYHKIGCTDNPERRLREFAVKLPFETEIVLLIKNHNATAFERMLHSTFDDKRIRGEWFDLSGDEIDFIKAMCDYMVADHSLWQYINSPTKN